ncbi:MAG TPA: PIG-L family deacetylase [Nitrolancea sp.]|nr:PIG-L family deacetylase [Nitrolancea sp.]
MSSDRVDFMVVSAHPDDAEVQMGGTIVKLIRKGLKGILIDLCDGEPSDFDPPGERVKQANIAAGILGVTRTMLEFQDRMIQDTIEIRLAIAREIRRLRPRWVFSTSAACVHPDHEAMEPIARAAVFYARLKHWDRVPGGEALNGTEPWEVDRLFFPHCKLEPTWGDFAFAVDVSDTYDVKQRALAEYRSIFRVEDGDQLLQLYEAEDAHMGRLFGVSYAEIFRSHSPLIVDDPTVFLRGIHA